MENTTMKKHSVIMEQRKHVVVAGVKDCVSFDEDTVILSTEMGELSIRGQDLHIAGYSVETGDLMMDGNIYALVYTNESISKQGMLSRLFK